MVACGAGASADHVGDGSTITKGVIKELVALYESSGQTALASRSRQEPEENATQ